MKNNRSKLDSPRSTATKGGTATKTAKPRNSPPAASKSRSSTATKPAPAKRTPAVKASKSRINTTATAGSSSFDVVDDLPEVLSNSERTVLNVFRRYQMAPGQMLCFSGSNLDSHKATLAKLIDKQMLLAEKFRGGYSLTKLGFSAMMSGEALRD